VELAGFDDWIYGLSAAAGDRVVIATPEAGSDMATGSLLVFDAKSGKRLSRIGVLPEQTLYRGVACATTGQAPPLSPDIVK
jgi:hypothetical protein